MSVDHSLAVVTALGWRVVHVPDLGRAALVLPEQGLVLVDDDLTDAGGSATLDAVLEHLYPPAARPGPDR